MKRFAILALVIALAAASIADACCRRGRRGDCGRARLGHRCHSHCTSAPACQPPPLETLPPPKKLPPAK